MGTSPEGQLLGHLTDQISGEVLARYAAGQVLHGVGAEQVLRRLFTALEESIARTCTTYSKLLLLNLSRMILPPRGLVNTSSTPSLELMPLRISTMAALKYGHENLELRFTGMPRGSTVKFTSTEIADAQILLELARFTMPN